ncbi:IclR family transcriptional regulator [Variovorax sp. YR216]|uniref:IclR family transcriptional regulator n=1 Tax=Variovorax sp. YR216 TaxID=1882828 RepID=UPI00089A051A|nr:IclR family transcriptional regulator [Variovorax sp. YR216]SEB24736.1 transcriptional regulator, IclR family [Variovorax sp. YR216]
MPSLVAGATRTLAVFEVFAREKRPLSNSDMARLLDLTASSSLDLLHTLHAVGYLMRTPRTLRYYPTARLWETAQQISENDPLSSVAREAVEQLAEKTGESAFFGVLDNDAAKVVAAQASRQPLRYVVEVGDRVSLHASALGKALLGLQSDEELAATIGKMTFKPVTARTITDPKRFRNAVTKGREQGWTDAQGEGTEGVDGLAVAGWIGELPVGLALAGPTERMERSRDNYLKALKDVAAALLGG